MPRNNDDGPWGSVPKSGDPKPKPDPEPGNPWMSKGTGPTPPGPTPPPDLDALLRKLEEWWHRFKPKGHLHAIGMAVSAVAFLWLASGLYQVASNQIGVVMRFGAFNRMENPGLRYHLPTPIEEVLLPVVTSQNEIPVGFRRSRHTDEIQSVPHESMMLTQDENVINVEFTVFWRVSDAVKFLFEIRDPETTVKMAAESVIREVIGQNKLQFALTDGRSQIADEARTRLQALMDEYNAGVVVSQINLQTVSVPDEVKAAFQDVVNARLDQERLQNQAAAHVNKVIPDSKGQAAQMIQQAMAYRDQKIAIAKGEADRFKEVLTAYNGARDVTARRLYLENMEVLLGNATKIVVDKSAGAGAIPYFPLSQFPKSKVEEGGSP
jgi:modulator of FtsH protease HflK